MAKSQEVFHFGSNLRKKLSNHSPEQLYLYLDSAQGSDMEIGAKLKAFLRLSHLESFYDWYLFTYLSLIFFDVVPFV